MAGYTIKRETTRKISRVEIHPDKDEVVVYEEDGDAPISAPLSAEMKLALKGLLESIDGVIEVTPA